MKKILILIIALLGSLVLIGSLYSAFSVGNLLIAISTEPEPIAPINLSMEYSPQRSIDFENKINEVRLNHNLKPLKHYEPLCKYTTKRMGDMQTTFNHDIFLADSTLIGNSMSLGYLSENISRAIDNEGAIIWLLNSKSHYEAIIRPQSNATCASCNGMYCVQWFATTTSSSPK